MSIAAYQLFVAQLDGVKAGAEAAGHLNIVNSINDLRNKVMEQIQDMEEDE